MFSSVLLTSFLALAASALPTSPSANLTPRQNSSPTRNDLVNGVCDAVTIIFARGTLELGNVGSLAGPPFFNALTAIIGSQNVGVQGVDYGATIAGYLEGGDPAGAATLASLVDLAVSQCPNTQILLSGYRSARHIATVYSYFYNLRFPQPRRTSRPPRRQADLRGSRITGLCRRFLWRPGRWTSPSEHRGK